MDPRDAVTIPDDGEDDDDAPSRLGRFELGRQLGAGGMGVVFEARDGLLERTVALKILRPVGETLGGGMLREAKALAKLVHPNVVTVFDAGLRGTDVFIAMELVEGETLKEWMSRARPWREVVDVFLAVGRGLAAVHALGLVHRDVKPSNVLLDRSGTPKVGDFGVVCHEGDDANGAVIGTPAYMAPEQRGGRVVGASADQFAFAVMLGEALGTPTPARLRPMLARATAQDPSLRYPSMGALLAELARARRGPLRWWLAGGGAALVAASVAAAWALGRAHAAAADPCPAAPPLWPAEQRAELRVHLSAIDPAEGAARFAIAARTIDNFGRDWGAMRVDACRATRVEGHQSDEMLDRRMACLDRTRAQLDATVAALGAASDPASLDATMHAVVALPPLTDCADTAALAEEVPFPADPAQRSTVLSLIVELATLDVAVQVDGTKDGLEARTAAAVARARRVSFPAVLAHALSVLGRIQADREESEAAVATFEEEIQVGAAAHDDTVVANAWIRKLEVLIDPLNRLEDVARLVPSAAAAVTRAGDRPDLRFELFDMQSRAALLQGDLPRARDLIAQALAALGDGEYASERAAARDLLAQIDVHAGNLEVAAAELRDVVDALTRRFGPAHPDLLHVLFNLGVTQLRLGRDDEALVSFHQAVEIAEARVPESLSLASTLYGLGATLLSMGHAADAISPLQRSADAFAASLPERDRRRAQPLADLAGALHGVGRDDEARTRYQEALAFYQRAGKPEPDWAAASYGLAVLEADTEHCDAVDAPAQRAAELYQTVAGPSSTDAADSLELIADCAVRGRRWKDAVAIANRVLAIHDSPYAHYYRGRALAESGRDRAGGVREVRAARAALAGAGAGADTLAELDGWLAKR